MGSQIHGVDKISGRYNIWSGNTISFKKNESGSYSIRGVHPDYQLVEQLTLVKGRFLNNNDQANSRKTVLISKLVDEALFKNGEESLGKYVSINKIPFKVVGIF